MLTMLTLSDKNHHHQHQDHHLFLPLDHVLLLDVAPHPCQVAGAGREGRVVVSRVVSQAAAYLVMTRDTQARVVR